MGTFRTSFRVESYPDMSQGFDIAHGLVDTGAEFTWAPSERLRGLGIRPLKSESFTTADGKVIKRDVGFAVVRLGGRFTVDEVIFARPGDLTLLGARSLEGLGLMIDARRKRLVAAGPAPAATAIRPGVARAMGIIVPPLRKARKSTAAKNVRKARLVRKRRQ
jgi:predicted aspartyl protease